MGQRLTMNSTALQEAFPETYREFFTKCEIVVSAPASFFWAGEDGPDGEVAVKQCLPLRTYVGLEAVSGSGLAIGNRQFLQPRLRAFRQKPSSLRTPAVLQLLQSEFARTGSPAGYRIHSLAEVPSGSGLATSACFSAALAVAVLLATRGLAVADVERWSGAPAEQLTTSDTPFDATFRLGWKLESIFHADASGGTGVFASLLGSAYPVVYTTERRTGNVASHPYSRLPLDIGEDRSVLDRAQYWGFRLNELFGFKRYRQWPVDFGLLYCGTSTNSELAVSATQAVREQLKRVESAVDPALAARMAAKQSVLPEFLKKYGPGHPSVAWWEVYARAVGVAAMETLGALRELLGRGYSEPQFGSLLRAVEISERLYRALAAPTGNVGLLQARLRRLAIEYDVPFATKTNGPGRAGDVLFVAPLYAMEPLANRMVAKLRRELGASLWLDYASWLDGFEERGVAVEQHIGEKRQSKLLPSGTVAVQVWTSAGEKTYSYPTTRLETAARSYDLLLDPIERTIAIRGQTLTSKELNSTKATLALLRALLANLGKSVPAAQLPVSAYPDRTAMQGKIIGPLKQIFRERTGKELPLTISGGVGKNFTVKLSIDELTIAAVERRY